MPNGKKLTFSQPFTFYKPILCKYLDATEYVVNDEKAANVCDLLQFLCCLPLCSVEMKNSEMSSHAGTLRSNLPMSLSDQLGDTLVLFNPWSSCSMTVVLQGVPMEATRYRSSRCIVHQDWSGSTSQEPLTSSSSSLKQKKQNKTKTKTKGNKTMCYNQYWPFTQAETSSAGVCKTELRSCRYIHHWIISPIIFSINWNIVLSNEEKRGQK